MKTFLISLFIALIFGATLIAVVHHKSEQNKKADRQSARRCIRHTIDIFKDTIIIHYLDTTKF
jgi:hypothetical protein